MCVFLVMSTSKNQSIYRKTAFLLVKIQTWIEFCALTCLKEKETLKLDPSLISINLDNQIWYLLTQLCSNHNFNFTAAVVSTSGEEDQELEKGNLEFTWKDAWLFLFPAVCDVTATSGLIFL